MPQRLNNIQVLRAIAAMCVVYFHTDFIAFGTQPVGQFGVAIFFVVSGFVMAMICASSQPHFLKRRLIRIVPLYWAATLAVFLVAALRPELLVTTRANGVELAKSLLFIPFYKNNLGIFPTLDVGWTLNYEMYFYVLLAVGLALFKKKAPLFAASVIVVATIVAPPLFGSTTFGKFYGNIVTLEFVYGLIAYHLIAQADSKLLSKLKPVLALAVVVSFLLFATIQSHQYAFISPLMGQHLFGVFGFLTVAGATGLTKAGWDLNSKLLNLLGDSSYAIYLSHKYVILLQDRVLSRRVPWVALSTVPGVVLGIMAAAGVGILIHLYVERPTLKYLNSRFLGRRNDERKPEILPAA